MYRVSLVRGYKGREYILEKGELVMLEVETNKSPMKELVKVRTRHGRKVTAPREILSKEIVKYTCQLCDTARMNTYEIYVMHMIEQHLRSQLVRGLDFMDGKLACPFKPCAQLKWSDNDQLLFHYASHHQVLDKVMMFETEKSSAEFKQKLKNQEKVITNLENDLANSNATRAEVLSLRDKEVKYLETVIASKDATINMLTDDLSDVKEENRALTNLNQTLEDRVNVLQELCKENNNKKVKVIESFEKENERLKDSVKSVEAKLILNEQELEKSLNENRELLGRVSELELTIVELESAVQNLDERIAFLTIQEEVLIDENDKLKTVNMQACNDKDAALAEIRRLTEENEAESSNLSDQAACKALLENYNTKCYVVEQLLMKNQKLDVEILRKDWEIECYKSKLDSLFESLLKVPRDIKTESNPLHNYKVEPTDVDTPVHDIKLERDGGESSRGGREDSYGALDLSIAGPSPAKIACFRP